MELFSIRIQRTFQLVSTVMLHQKLDPCRRRSGRYTAGTDAFAGRKVGEAGQA